MVESTSNWRPHLAIVLVLIATLHCGRCEVGSAEDGKIDLLLRKLDQIEEKLNQVDQKIGACGCGGDAANQGADSIFRQRIFIKRDAEKDTLPPRDLFHFNKLADNLNAIPASSSINEQPQNEQSESQGVLAADKRIVMTIGQHYESLFGNALENLNLMLKEQLAAFRLTLNKLMNRLADHSYQHSVLTNQLALVKDECSLASSYADVAANLSYSLMSQMNNSSSGSVARSTPSALVEQNTMRSSDIMMIVRLLGVELDQLIQRSVAAKGEQMKLSQTDKSQVCRSHQPESEEQERQLRLGASIEREMQSFQRRIEEIDSVVKHSANMLSRLAYSSSPGQPLGLDRYPAHKEGSPTPGQTRATTINYSNDNETLAGTQPVGSKSRWFAGSKTPNQPVLRLAGEQSSQVASRPRPKCQAKTNLVRPTSCRQLREAGANCTGQYYVFVRGAIKHVYCDMNMDSADDGGGWTVVLRRIDKSLGPSPASESEESSVPAASSSALKWLDAIKASQLDFRHDWANYKNGFGYLDSWSEFFIGLELLQQIVSTDSQTHELQLDLITNKSHQLHLKFDAFSLEDESHQYRVHVGACNATDASICRPISSLESARFYTQDSLLKQFCPISNETERSAGLQPKLPGWWLSAERLPTEGGSGTNLEQCHQRLEQMLAISATDALTGPIGRQQADNESSPTPINHLHWPNWQHSHEPIRQLTLKVRQRRAQQSAP